MEIKRNIFETLQQLESFTPRLYENEEKVAEFIIEFLRDRVGTLNYEEFYVHYPVYEECYLLGIWL